MNVFQILDVDRNQASIALLTFKLSFPGQYYSPRWSDILVFMRHRAAHVRTALYMHILAIVLKPIDATFLCDLAHSVHNIRSVDRSRMFGILYAVKFVEYPGRSFSVLFSCSLLDLSYFFATLLCTFDSRLKVR